MTDSQAHRKVQGISRRDFVRGASTLAVSGAVAACASSTQGTVPLKHIAAKRVTLNIASGPDIHEPAWPLEQVAKNYEEKNPKIKIKITTAPTLTAQQAVQKYALEARNGTADFDMWLGPNYASVPNLAAAGAIAAIDQYLPKGTIQAMPKSVNHGNRGKGGKRYSLPFWSDVLGFIYRKDYLTQALGSSTPPATWQQLLSYATTVKQKLGPEISAFGADWIQANRFYLPLLLAYGGKAFDSRGLLTVQGDAANMALQWIQKLYPFMPANSMAPLGSSQTFQANKLAMESYWPAQIGRAVAAGVPMDKIGLAGNLKGERSATLFWTTDAVVFKNAPHKEEAVRFMVEGFLKNSYALQQSRKLMKIIPYNFKEITSSVPGWEAPLRSQLDNGVAPPNNVYLGAFENDAFTSEVEKMVLKGQPIKTTLSNMKSSFQEGLKKSQ